MPYKMKYICLPVVFLFSVLSCTSVPQNVGDGYAVENEKMGLMVCRIHNELAGKSLSWFNNEQELPFKPFELNSDIEIMVYPISLFSMKIRNVIPTDQFVLIPMKSGEYYINAIGKYTDLTRPYRFSIEKGTINYIGDITIELLEQKISPLAFPTDIYRFKIEDKFDEMIQIMRITYPDLLDRYELVNKSQPMDEYVYPLLYIPD